MKILIKVKKKTDKLCIRLLNCKRKYHNANLSYKENSSRNLQKRMLCFQCSLEFLWFSKAGYHNKDGKDEITNSDN